MRRKNEEYAYGDLRADGRRAVLDDTLVIDLEDVIVVVSPADFLGRFFAYIPSVSEAVDRTGRFVLVLMFGHRIEDVFSIKVGGKGAHDRRNKLTKQQNFSEALLRHNPDPNVPLLTPLCFGGGWVLTNFIKLSGIADGDRETETLLRAENVRCCGLRYATGIVKALISMGVQGLDPSSDEGPEVLSWAIYEALVTKIYKSDS